jgi:preprotein translocase subunit SecG
MRPSGALPAGRLVPQLDKFILTRVLTCAALLGVVLPAADPALAKPAEPVVLAPPTQAGSELRLDMKKILSGRDYRQLRREALRAKEKEKPPRKSCQDDNSKGCQGCRDCGEGCRSCGGAGAGGGASSLASGLLYLIVILAVVFLIGLIAWSIAKHWKKKATDDEDDLSDAEALMPSVPPGERPSSEYLQRALALSDQGDHRGAIRQLLLGCMSWIERHGLLRYRKGLTNRDYLRAVYRRQTQREGISGVITEFELIYFGRRDATSERFRRCLSGFRSGFDKDEVETAH